MERVVKNTTIFLALTEVKKVKKSFLPLLCSVLTEVESFGSPLFDKGINRGKQRKTEKNNRGGTEVE